jgi:hypothetical protein
VWSLHLCHDRFETTGTLMTTAIRLETWWATLDEEARAHAHRCVENGWPDDTFLESLHAARIGLTRTGWASHGSRGGHIPRAIEEFVQAHPVP